MNTRLKRLSKSILTPLILLGFLILMPGVSSAAEYFLRADVTTIAMPDGTTVTMWGFAQDSAFDVPDGTVTIPGPMLIVPPGDTTLTLHVKNNLTPANTGLSMGCPVSIIIPGQITDQSPVYFGAAPYPQFEGRVRSLTHETQPGNIDPVDYIWTNVKPGTYIYHSGTHMQCHVQMGLYGAVKKDAEAGVAYPGVPYDNEVILFYSEIDPAFHEAVATSNYGPGTTMTSTVNYSPQYFLINGEPFSGDPNAPGVSAIVDHPINYDERVLIRFLNAGLQTHVPTLDGMYMTLISEDGHPYTYPRSEYSALLPALKTLDVILEPQTQKAMTDDYFVYDRALSLTNGMSSPGGMLVSLTFSPGASAANSAPIAVGNSFSTAMDVALNVAAPGVLMNDADLDGDSLTAALVDDVTTGTLTLNADGSFNYVPAAGIEYMDSFTYVATDGLLNSNIATVNIIVGSGGAVAVKSTESLIDERRK